MILIITIWAWCRLYYFIFYVITNYVDPSYKFAGIIDFNGLIGAPVHRYRDRYKDIEKLREAFFRRVTSVSHIEKFTDYYKWFDSSVLSIISQLLPGSSVVKLTGFSIDPMILS